MSLLDGEIDALYKVERVDMQGSILRRLQALGLIEGTKIKVLNNKRSGSVIFRVRGTRLAVGRKIARAIKIHPIDDKSSGEDAQLSRNGGSHE